MPVNTESRKSTSTYFSQKPSKYYYTYDTSKSEMENLSDGYVDTFSVAGTKFQLLSNPDTSGDLELQVMKHGRWQTNLKLPYGINGNEATTDINEDGYNDFISSLLRGNKVYLFDTSKQQFYREPISFAFEWSIIDKAKKIYSNNYSSHDYYVTDLFKLDGFKQTFYYTALIEYNFGNGTETVTLRLYKIRNSNLEDTVFITQRKFDMLHGDFDYKKFWSEIVKQKGNH